MNRRRKDKEKIKVKPKEDKICVLHCLVTSRYEQLMKIRGRRKLLLTGTPLQNNLVELMSLLIFVMPGMFAKKKEQLRKMFSLFPKTQDESERFGEIIINYL